MLLTLLMLGLAIACAAIGIWAVRRPAANDTAVPSPPARKSPDQAAGSPTPAPPRSTELLPRSGTQEPASQAVPAPRPAPAPVAEALPKSLAFLEFEGALGRVHIERPEVVIGRHTQDDIRINDVRVSRHHARLVAKRNGGFEIHNLTSVRSEPNPMQINGETREHADIVDGDVVTLGGVSFVFRMAA